MMETNLRDAARWIAESGSVVLATHLMPDGDGLGAEMALFHYLHRLGKRVQILNPDPVPERYRFLDKNGVFKVWDSRGRSRFQEVDLAIVVDTHDPQRLGPVWDLLQEKAKAILILDHHPQIGHFDGIESLQLAKVRLVVDEKSSSIGELLYRLFVQGNDVLAPSSTAFHLSPEIALGLYVSIMTDTNSFRYARTTALSHRIAADLIDFGLQPEEIYQNVYATKSARHLRLIGAVLSEVQQTADGRVAWIEINKALRDRFGVNSDDTQTIVNFLLLLKDVEILILLREEDDLRIKASLKSRGGVQVHQIARSFGGGGHEFASGFTCTGTLAEIRDRLLAKVALEFDPLAH